MKDGIELLVPTESPRNFNHFGNNNYFLVVLFEQDCAQLLKVERLHVFESINSIKEWLNENSWSYYIIPDNSLIVFETTGFEEFFANIFWGRNHLENIKKLKGK